MWGSGTGRRQRHGLREGEEEWLEKVPAKEIQPPSQPCLRDSLPAVSTVRAAMATHRWGRVDQINGAHQPAFGTYTHGAAQPVGEDEAKCVKIKVASFNLGMPQNMLTSQRQWPQKHSLKFRNLLATLGPISGNDFVFCSEVGGVQQGLEAARVDYGNIVRNVMALADCTSHGAYLNIWNIKNRATAVVQSGTFKASTSHHAHMFWQAFELTYRDDTEPATRDASQLASPAVGLVVGNMHITCGGNAPVFSLRRKIVEQALNHLSSLTVHAWHSRQDFPIVRVLVGDCNLDKQSAEAVTQNLMEPNLTQPLTALQQHFDVRQWQVCDGQFPGPALQSATRQHTKHMSNNDLDESTNRTHTPSVPRRWLVYNPRDVWGHHADAETVWEPAIISAGPLHGKKLSGDMMFVLGCFAEERLVPVGLNYDDRGMRNDQHDVVGAKLMIPIGRSRPSTTPPAGGDGVAASSSAGPSGALQPAVAPVAAAPAQQIEGHEQPAEADRSPAGDAPQAAGTAAAAEQTRMPEPPAGADGPSARAAPPAAPTAAVAEPWPEPPAGARRPSTVGLPQHAAAAPAASIEQQQPEQLQQSQQHPQEQLQPQPRQSQQHPQEQLQPQPRLQLQPQQELQPQEQLRQQEQQQQLQHQGRQTPSPQRRAQEQLQQQPLQQLQPQEQLQQQEQRQQLQHQEQQAESPQQHAQQAPAASIEQQQPEPLQQSQQHPQEQLQPQPRLQLQPQQELQPQEQLRQQEQQQQLQHQGRQTPSPQRRAQEQLQQQPLQQLQPQEQLQQQEQRQQLQHQEQQAESPQQHAQQELQPRQQLQTRDQLQQQLLRAQSRTYDPDSWQEDLNRQHVEFLLQQLQLQPQQQAPAGSAPQAPPTAAAMVPKQLQQMPQMGPAYDPNLGWFIATTAALPQWPWWLQAQQQQQHQHPQGLPLTAYISHGAPQAAPTASEVRPPSSASGRETPEDKEVRELHETLREAEEAEDVSPLVQQELGRILFKKRTVTKGGFKRQYVAGRAETVKSIKMLLRRRRDFMAAHDLHDSPPGLLEAPPASSGASQPAGDAGGRYIFTDEDRKQVMRQWKDSAVKNWRFQDRQCSSTDLWYLVSPENLPGNCAPLS